MAEYDVIAKVASQKADCSAGHKVGDEFLIGHETPTGLCLWAYHMLLPFARVLRYGGSFPCPDPSGTVTITCPSPNQLTLQLRRLQK